MDNEKFKTKYNFLLSLTGIINGVYLLDYNHFFIEINTVSLFIQLVLPLIFVVYLLLLCISTKKVKKIYLVWLITILMLLLYLGFTKFI